MSVSVTDGGGGFFRKEDVGKKNTGEVVVLGRGATSKRAWEKHVGCTCVECPSCAFLFDESHTDDGEALSYSCPNCAEIELRAALGVAAREAAGGNERTYERLTEVLWAGSGHRRRSWMLSSNSVGAATDGAA